LEPSGIGDDSLLGLIFHAFGLPWVTYQSGNTWGALGYAFALLFLWVLLPVLLVLLGIWIGIRRKKRELQAVQAEKTELERQLNAVQETLSVAFGSSPGRPPEATLRRRSPEEMAAARQQEEGPRGGLQGEVDRRQEALRGTSASGAHASGSQSRTKADQVATST
jgi:hypothetical protein